MPLTVGYTANGAFPPGIKSSMDGVPMWRPKWWSQIGRHTGPRATYNKDLYPPGTHRMVVDGVPYRVAAHVKGWKPHNKAALLKGYDRFGLTLRPYGTKTNPALEHYGDLYWHLSYQRRAADEKIYGNQWNPDLPPDLFQLAARRARLARRLVKSKRSLQCGKC